jgi:hypothetical protein
VHMNGRVYDAELGRMLSADPFVPEAVNPQAFNRYSYVLNNPLSYTDPSGFFFKKLFKAVVKVFKKVFKFIASIPIIRKIAPFVVASFCGPAAAACAAVVAGGLEAASGGSIFAIMPAAYSAASGVHSDFGLQDAIRAGVTGLDGGGGDGESVKEKVSRVSAGARTWVLGAFKSANGAVTGAFEFAVGLIPFVNATRELLGGNLRGALIEAGIDVAIIGVGAVTFGVGAVALKGLRGARVVTRDRALEKAQDVLGDSLTRIAGRPKSRQPAVAVGGTSTSTGRTAAGQSVSGCGGKRCAELDVAAQVGGNPRDIVFTKPVRPRTGEIVPVCKDCQKVFGRDQFPPGTPFE